MVVQAISKGVRMSPRKVGVVAALVRGQTVNNALTILDHTPRRSAEPVRKAIASAKANAEKNHGLKPDSLTITEIIVTPGARQRRYRPAARGRALPYVLRSSHIRVVIDGEKRPVKKPAAAKPAANEEAK